MKPLNWQQAIANRYQRLLMSLTVDQDAELQRIVGRAAKDAERILAGLPDEGVGAFVRRAQYAQTRAALASLSDEMWTTIGSTIDDGISVSSQLAVNANRELLQVLTRAAGPMRAAALAESMLSSAARTFLDVRSRMINAIPLSANVYKNRALLNGTIDRIVNDGIALGQSAKEIASNVGKYISPDVMGGQKYAAMRLGRTELNNAYHTTSVASMQESPYVKGVLWNLSGSHPADDVCNDYAEDVHTSGLGKGVFLPNDVPAKPHPQCFCYITAILPSADEFVDDLVNGEFSCGGV